MAWHIDEARERVMTFLGDRETRAFVHAGVLLAGAFVLLTAELRWEIFQGAPEAVDKAMHYHVGRIASMVTFYLAYLCIVARVLIVGREGGSMTRVLLWIPACIAAGFCAAMAVVFVLAFGKEVADLGGHGNPDWLDIGATIEGALTMTMPVAIIMALTPLMIPLDLLLQLPRLMLADVRTGVEAVDDYLKVQKRHRRRVRGADVLLVEDDITCATTVMNFCSNVGLSCHHTATISGAEHYMRRHSHGIRLLVLDNFVRVDGSGRNRTGLDWLRDLSTEIPPDSRTFRVVMISGHTELLGDTDGLADLVLQKPWSPFRLSTFLDTAGVIAAHGPRGRTGRTPRPCH